MTRPFVALDDACAQLRELVRGTDDHIEVCIRGDGRVEIRRVTYRAYDVITHRADLETDSTELPSVLLGNYSVPSNSCLSCGARGRDAFGAECRCVRPGPEPM